MNWRVKRVEDLLASSTRSSLPRALGATQLVLLGVGIMIGTGIFVLAAQAAQKAGPGMMVSFVIAGLVSAVTALCYAELAAMVPVAGSAYTYSYAVFGELLAWLVGWALIGEYAVAASAVAVGWSHYFVGFVQNFLHMRLPTALAGGPMDGGIVNLPAFLVVLLVTGLLYVGTRESARVNAVLVAIKIIALTTFIVLTLPVIKSGHFVPFAPLGLSGIGGAAASIFFAYVGFDALATAAEEARDPQRNLPIGLIGSLVICTIFYLLVSAGAIGAIGAQPIKDPATGHALATGSVALAAACNLDANLNALACSGEALAHVLRQIQWPKIAAMLGVAAFVALPSVVLICIFAQTRIAFVMSRDRLLPASLSSVHPRFKTPHVMTVVTGLIVACAAALFPVGQLADVANAGTLFAFMMAAAGVMWLRRSQPHRHRPFRTPALGVVGPLAIAGCVYLFYSLGAFTQIVFVTWCGVGGVVYLTYGRTRSPLAQPSECTDMRARHADADR
ncbi:MAG: amino acid permease [Proteobacteria bacterium]|nr:amino acid permease [Pseudomonadota bacterium]